MFHVWRGRPEREHMFRRNIVVQRFQSGVAVWQSRPTLLTEEVDMMELHRERGLGPWAKAIIDGPPVNETKRTNVFIGSRKGATLFQKGTA